MLKHSKIYFFGVLSLIVLFTISHKMYTQNNFDIVVGGNFSLTSNYTWSWDNQTFTFLDRGIVSSNVGVGVELSAPAWQQFNVITQTLSAGTTSWPLQPTLTPAEQSAFQPIDFVLAAPDNQLMAFGVSGIGRIAIGNRITQQYVTTEILTGNPDFINRQAFWSADSSAFVYNRGAELIPSPLLYYTRIPDSVNLSTLVTTRFNNIVINGDTYMMAGELENEDRLFDISTDGSRVLLTAQQMPDDQLADLQFSELIIWYPENNPNNTVIELFDAQQICNASFAPDNDHQVVVLLSDGQLMLYDLQYQSIKKLSVTLPVLDDCTTTAPSFYSIFSQDGKWLAMVDLLTGQLAFLDILRLISDPSALLLQPPVANAGQGQIIPDISNNGVERVVLDASDSFDPDGTLTHMVWSQLQTVLSLASDQTVALAIGENHLTLTVIDNDGLIDRDEIVIIIESSSIPCSANITCATDSYTLLNANTSSEIGPLNNNNTLNLAALGTTNLAIRANIIPSTVGSVIFDLNGVTQIDNILPYELTNWTPTPGQYALTATPYSSADGQGVAGTPLTINFSVVDPIICSSTVGDTTALLTAITYSNSTPESDTICLEEGTYTLTTANNTSDGANGLPVITSDITLRGLGAGAIIIGELVVTEAGSLRLENVTISDQ